MGKFQVTLEHLKEPDTEPHEEIVRAKFVLGADGLESQCHHAFTPELTHTNRSPFMGQESIWHKHGWRTEW